MERLAKRRIPGRVPGRFQGYSWRVRLRLREGGRGVAQEGGAVELLLPAAAFAAAGSQPGTPMLLWTVPHRMPSVSRPQPVPPCRGMPFRTVQDRMGAVPGRVQTVPEHAG